MVSVVEIKDELYCDEDGNATSKTVQYNSHRNWNEVIYIFTYQPVHW